MCGIWAIINRLQLTSQQILSFEEVTPRGPDHSIIHLSKSSILGFHRLAINELGEKGQQPFQHRQEPYRYTVMCNGEIYNHRALRQTYTLEIDSKSDCAVILPLFLKFNERIEDLTRQLRGQYAMLITKQHLKSGDVEYFLSTDPLSVRPVFYFSSESQFGCSSLLSGLTTFSQNVKRLEQGTYIHGIFKASTQQNQIIEIKRYHTPPKVTYTQQNLQLYKLIVDTFKAAVEDRLMSERPIGCLLSGGLDSSLVASVACHLMKQKGKQLKTYSIGMKEGTDIVYAREVAAHIGSDHTEYIYEPEEGLNHLKDVIKVTETFDITTIRASVGQFLIAKRISSMTDTIVVLNGDGADQCQMGYLYYYLAPNPEQAKKDRDRLVQEIHLYDGLRVDRNISHFGLQARVPFLDQRFVDLYYEICPKLIMPTQDRMEKYLIRRAFEVVWPEVLPKSVLWRKKQAFSDGVSSKEKSWYQMVKQHVETVLYPELLKREGPITTMVDDVKFEGVQPVCAESQFYRLFHAKAFNGNHSMLKHYWLPSWAGVTEPSARVLRVYNESKTNIDESS